jgi:hypothetical protein
MDIRDIWHCGLLLKLIDILQLWLRFSKNNGLFTWTRARFSAHISRVGLNIYRSEKCEISGYHGDEYEDGWLSSGMLRRVVW